MRKGDVLPFQTGCTDVRVAPQAEGWEINEPAPLKEGTSYLTMSNFMAVGSTGAVTSASTAELISAADAMAAMQLGSKVSGNCKPPTA